tara:strand:- start:663 stop:803 length:141 start_codon:yes stop_codon:yes gene_type:complete
LLDFLILWQVAWLLIHEFASLTRGQTPGTMPLILRVSMPSATMGLH